MKRLRFLMIFIVGLIFAQAMNATALWVGQSYTCDASSAVMGLTSDVSWTTNGGYFSMSGSGFYRNITVTQYFSGSATIKCSWKYRLYSGDQWRTQSKSWTITCNDNPCSISPTSMTLAVGESDYVGYSLKYSNSYTSAANVYYSSSNSSIATVDEHTGKVTARGSGTTYITCYSKVSANSPYCTVTVKDVSPQSAYISSPITVEAGEKTQLSVSVSPSNATVNSYSWKSTNTEIATINSAGMLTGVKHGSTTVYCIINGNIKSNEAEVTVTKSQLTLSASVESGLIEKGKTVTLLASDNNAKIYYTTDGTSPNNQSHLYSQQIVVNSNLTLKAIAIHDDYRDSEILTRNYSVTDLKIKEWKPQNGSNGLGYNIRPTITFNQDIFQGDAFDFIKMIKGGEEEIQIEKVINGATLYIVPNTKLEDGSYSITLPLYALKNLYGETNMQSTTNFSIGNNAYPIMGNGCSSMVVVKSDGSLWNWGRYPYTNDSWIYNKTPTKILNLSNVKFADTGDLFLAAITNDGALWTWGQNGHGQLGNGTNDFQSYPLKIMDGVKSVATDSHMLILKDDGSVWSCGYNYCGQLGNGSSGGTNNPIPKKIEGLSNIVSVYADFQVSAALQEDGTLWSWGSGGHVGDGTNTMRTRPKQIMTNVRQACITTMIGFAVKNDNSLWYWSDSQLSPKKIMDDVNFVSSSNYHYLFVKTDGSLWGWGQNEDGQLGNNTTTSTGRFSSYGNSIKIMDSVQSAWAGAWCSVAITNDNSLWTWGSNRYYCVGNGVEENQLVPLQIMDGKHLIALEGINTTDEKVTLPVGSSKPILVELNPLNADYEEISYNSEDETVATVSEFGIVKGVSQGQTRVIVTVTSSDGSLFTEYYDIKVVETTGINEIVLDKEIDNSYIYNLSGQQVKDSVKGTLLIKKGKKFIRK